MNVCGNWVESVIVQEGVTYLLSIEYTLIIDRGHSYSFSAFFICGDNPRLYSYRTVRKGQWDIAGNMLKLTDEAVIADQIRSYEGFPIDSEALRNSVLLDWPIRTTKYEIISNNENTLHLQSDLDKSMVHRFSIVSEGS